MSSNDIPITLTVTFSEDGSLYEAREGRWSKAKVQARLEDGGLHGFRVVHIELFGLGETLAEPEPDEGYTLQAIAPSQAIALFRHDTDSDHADVTLRAGRGVRRDEAHALGLAMASVEGIAR